MSQKPLLLVFIGKPGVGKTTLINKIKDKNHIIFDVMPFVLAYGNNDNLVPEQKTILGYQDMYKKLNKNNKKDILLELGTNHPELNTEQLEILQKKYNVQVYLLDAPKDTCKKRYYMRENPTLNDEALKTRLDRDFPKIYIDYLNKHSLNYRVLDMTKDLKDNFNLIIS